MEENYEENEQNEPKFKTVNGVKFKEVTIDELARMNIKTIKDVERKLIAILATIDPKDPAYPRISASLKLIKAIGKDDSEKAKNITGCIKDIGLLALGAVALILSFGLDGNGEVPKCTKELVSKFIKY